MAILGYDAFQPPLPSLLFLVPPGSALQWPLRFLLLAWTTFFSLPLFLFLIPLSVLLSRTSYSHWAPLPLHPDNLPPQKPILESMARGVWMYYLSAALWSITSLGNAPDSMNASAARKLADASMRVTTAIDEWAGEPVPPLEIREEKILPLEKQHRIGVLREEGMRDEEISGFWLTRSPSPASHASASRADATRRRRVYLFFSGGGYVTGAPLGHPFLFALARRFPSSSPSSASAREIPESPDHAIFAINVHHSLSLDRAFPVPLLDAVAAYAHLRGLGYDAGEVTVMGDSAGAGLVWSLVAYLAVLQNTGRGNLGTPGEMICCSPWWALPPTTAPLYPDLLDTPQLLQAARCYLGRYPLLKHRPNPFESDWGLWADWMRLSLRAAEQRIFSAVIGVITGARSKTRSSEERLQTEAEALLDPSPPRHQPKALVDWLNPGRFQEMTSHHPLISPATDPSSPFVARVLDVLARERTRVLIHAGTAEWFHASAVVMYQTMKRQGVDATFHEDVGGYHSEPAYLPIGIWAPGKRWVESIEAWHS